MPPSRAFEDEVILDGDVLIVSGQSDILHLAELVSRHVVIGQGTQVSEDAPAVPLPPGPPPPDEEGPAPAGKGWRVEVPAEGFELGPATALGAEIYSVRDGAQPGLPLLLTVSWSQSVEITEP